MALRGVTEDWSAWVEDELHHGHETPRAAHDAGVPHLFDKDGWIKAGRIELPVRPEIPIHCNYTENLGRVAPWAFATPTNRSDALGYRFSEGHVDDPSDEYVVRYGGLNTTAAVAHAHDGTWTYKATVWTNNTRTA